MSGDFFEVQKKRFQKPMTDPWDERYNLPTWMVDFLMVNVGKYTNPMDDMGNSIAQKREEGEIQKSPRKIMKHQEQFVQKPYTLLIYHR